MKTHSFILKLYILQHIHVDLDPLVRIMSNPLYLWSDNTYKYYMYDSKVTDCLYLYVYHISCLVTILQVLVWG